MTALRTSPAWWWKSRAPDPLKADLLDYERTLLALSDEEWSALTATPRVERDAEGSFVTGNAFFDRWEKGLLNE
mgnify:CR=1 FL=1